MVIGIVFIWLKLKKDEEKLLLLKTIGYSFLGAFRVFLGTIALPIGFLIGMFMAGNTNINKEVKIYAVLLGFILAYASWIFPIDKYIEQALYPRDQIQTYLPIDSEQRYMLEVRDMLDYERYIVYFYNEDIGKTLFSALTESEQTNDSTTAWRYKIHINFDPSTSRFNNLTFETDQEGNYIRLYSELGRIDFKGSDNFKQLLNEIRVELDKQSSNLDNRINGLNGIFIMDDSLYKTLLKTKTFILEDTNEQLELSFIKDNILNEITIKHRDDFMNFVKKKDSNEYYISHNGSIYLTDTQNGLLKPILNDNHYKQNFKNEIDEWESENGKIIWGTLLSINPSGVYLLFYSERDVFQGNKEGSIWVKDLLTGDEYSLFIIGGPSNIKGWSDENHVVINGLDTKFVNVKTGEYKILVEDSRDISLIKDNIVYGLEPGKVIMQNIETADEKILEHHLLNHTGSYLGNHSWLSLRNNINNDSFSYMVLLYNKESSIWRVINVPEGFLFYDYKWINDEEILLYLNKIGIPDVYAQIVKISEIEIINN